jgi:hypothetical protein
MHKQAQCAFNVGTFGSGGRGGPGHAWGGRLSAEALRGQLVACMGRRGPALASPLQSLAAALP